MPSLETHRAIEQFLFYEARLLDEARYDDWLTLLTEDVRYWMPIRETQDTLLTGVRSNTEMAMFDDDKPFLRARIQRLHTGLAHAETPPSRTRRFISNIEIAARKDGDIDAHCNLLVHQTRLERTAASYVGRREDILTPHENSWRIKYRKIVLDQTLMPRTISIMF
ncbi:MAG: 3-phenylpropionate/cinnamic acid dioxygenase subunit beta [Alphaproteobacteria bacterium]